MSLRITFLAISTLLFSRLGVLAQVDAQDRTQTFFDNNKGADVTNPTRALTDRIRQPQGLTHQSTLPPLTGVPDAARAPKRKASTKERRELRKQQVALVPDQVKTAQKAQAGVENMQMLAEPGAGNVNETQKKQLTEKKREKTESGKRLRQSESRSRESFLPPLTK
jgi:hypothetical protein